MSVILNQKFIKNILIYFLCFVSTSIFLEILIFKYPSSSLDGSWHYYMSYAFLEKLNFTSQIIFTYGPLGMLHAKTYIPDIFEPYIVLQLILISTYSLVLFEFLVKKNFEKYFIILLMTLFLKSEVGYFIFYIIFYENFKFRKKFITRDYLAIIPIFIFPLVKTVFIIPSSILFAFLIFINRGIKKTIIFSSISFLYLILIWKYANQDPLSLYNYIFNFFLILDGYSENLSLIGSYYEILISIAFLIFIFIVLIKKNFNYLDIVFYFLFFFLLFKTGFVRHDGHAIKFFCFTLFFVIIVLNIKQKLTITLIFLTSLSYYYSLINHNLDNILKERINNISNTIVGGGNALFNFQTFIANLNERHDLKKKNIVNKYNFIKYKNQSADIYNFNQGIVLANNIIPKFRPSFQSFNASNVFLIEKNLQFIKKNIPGIIFFKLQTIDNNFPFGDDSLNFLTFQKKYKLIDYKNDYLIFRFDKNIIPNETIEILKIDIEPTLIGKILKFFFKIPKIQISFELKDGSNFSKHIGSSNLKKGIILSPFIDSSEELLFLLSDPNILEKKKVKKYKIDSFMFKFFWKINKKKIEKFKFQSNLSNLSFLNKRKVKFKNFPNQFLKIDCKSSIEKDFSSKKGKFFYIKGWFFSKDFIEKKKPILIFKNNNVAKYYISIEAHERPDVANYFKNIKYLNSGFSEKIKYEKEFESFSLGYQGEQFYECK